MGRRLRLRSQYLHKRRACLSISRLRVFNRRSRRRRRIPLCRRRRPDGLRRQGLQETQGLRMGRQRLRRRRLRQRIRLTPDTTRKLPTETGKGRRRLERIRLRGVRIITSRLRTETRMGRGRLVRSHHLHQRLRRLQRRISSRLRVCHRSDRTGLCCSGRCHLYKLSRRRGFLRAKCFHRVEMSPHRRRV
jgi:hypothetical protein